jgi:hypothetical protein
MAAMIGILVWVPGEGSEPRDVRRRLGVAALEVGEDNAQAGVVLRHGRFVSRSICAYVNRNRPAILLGQMIIEFQRGLGALIGRAARL